MATTTVKKEIPALSNQSNIGDVVSYKNGEGKIIDFNKGVFLIIDQKTKATVPVKA